MTRLYHEIEDTVYFWFGANDTSGSGADGATPVADVRLAGAAASAIPTLSPTPVLLTHANFPPGCHELAVAATVSNGFAADSTYAVFTTLLVDSQNPTGFLGSFTLSPVLSNPWDELKGDHNAWDSFGHSIQGLVPITGRVTAAATSTINWESDGFTEATNEHFTGSVVVFTSGALLGQARIVSAYLGTGQEFTVGTALTSAPANNDEFVVLGPITASLDRQFSSDSSGNTNVAVARWLNLAPNALVSGRVDASVGAMAAGTVTAAAVATGAIDADAIAADAITNAKIANDAIGATEIANGAIDAATFAAGAIDAAAIATDAIDSTKIAAGAIGASEIATDAIDDDAIATGAIASTAFAAGAIDAAAIATDAINVTKIAPNAIGSDELATSAAAKIRGVGPTGSSDSGTASTIVDATAGGFGDSTTDDFWNGMVMY